MQWMAGGVVYADCRTILGTSERQHVVKRERGHDQCDDHPVVDSRRVTQPPEGEAGPGNALGSTRAPTSRLSPPRFTVPRWACTSFAEGLHDGGGNQVARYGGQRVDAEEEDQHRRHRHAAAHTGEAINDTNGKTAEHKFDVHAVAKLIYLRSGPSSLPAVLQDRPSGDSLCVSLPLHQRLQCRVLR